MHTDIDMCPMYSYTDKPTQLCAIVVSSGDMHYFSVSYCYWCIMESPCINNICALAKQLVHVVMMVNVVLLFPTIMTQCGHKYMYDVTAGF